MEFTDSEIDRIREMVTDRYRKDVKLRIINNETNSSDHPENSNPSSGIFWHVEGINFLISKTGEAEFSGSVYSTPHDLHHTQQKRHKSLDQCMEDIIQTRHMLGRK